MQKLDLRLVCDIENLLIVSQVFYLGCLFGANAPPWAPWLYDVTSCGLNSFGGFNPLYVAGSPLRGISLPNFVD